MSNESFESPWPPLIREFVATNAGSFDQTLPWLYAFGAHVLGDASRIDFVRSTDEAGRISAALPLHEAVLEIYPHVSRAAIVAPSNYYTGLVAPVCGVSVNRVDYVGLACECLARSSAVCAFDLNPLEDGSEFIDSLTSVFEENGWWVEIYKRFGNWIESIEGRSFAEYLSDRPSQLRATLLRRGKRFLSTPGAALRIVSDPSEVDGALDRYEHVYRLSWKQAEPFADFIRAVAREFAARNWLRIGLVEIDNVPIAAQIWFVYRDTASIFKLAYDPEYRNLSAGSLLSSAMFECAIDRDRVSVIDYLCGDDRYKQDWMSLRRQRVGFRAVRKRSIPGAMEFLRRATRR